MPTNLRSPAYRAFVDHLVALRNDAGVTQQALADLLKKPQSYVSKSERYERRLDPAEFHDIAIALGRDPAEEFRLVAEGLRPR